MSHGNTNEGVFDWLGGNIDESIHRTLDNQPGGGWWAGVDDAIGDLLIDDRQGHDSLDIPGPGLVDIVFGREQGFMGVTFLFWLGVAYVVGQVITVNWNIGGGSN